MNEQELEPIEQGEQEEFAYSDFMGVTFMIQQYYYSMLALFQRYYNLKLRGKDYYPLRQQIQSFILILAEMLKNYTPIRNNKNLNKLFSDIIEFASTERTFNYDRMLKCVNSITDAHYILGLSKLEFKKKEKKDPFTKYKSSLK